MLKVFCCSLLILAFCPALLGQTNEPAARPPDETATASQSAGEKNIRFQFDGIPYMDVAERFAQMAGKPLIAETNIQGTMTFNDPRPYNYDEAMETLNTILGMKGVMLVETDRYLRLVPFTDLPQMPLKIFRGMEQTGDVRGGEVVTVVMELKNLDAGELAKATTTMLSDAGSIAPLSRGKGLIITDKMENIRRIRQLITEIDTHSPSERQMRTYTLLHASGAVVADLINKTFGVATAPKRTSWNEARKTLDVLPPNPEDYVTAVFDEASRTMLLFGPAERIQMAEDLIQRFENKDGAAGGDVKIYYPQVSKADALAKMIRQAIPGVAEEGESGTAAATKARVIVDAAMNRLIVTAPIAGQLDSIENLINRVERSSNGGSGLAETPSDKIQITKVIKLRLADPTTAFRVVTNAFVRRAPNGDMAATLKANLDEPTKTLVVTGSPGDVQHALGIIEQMENIGPASGPQETIFLDFGSSSELKRVQPLIEQLYASQVADGTPTGAPMAKFLPDAESKRLIVTASKPHLELIGKIAEQVKSPALATQPREFRALPLKHVKVDQAFQTITDLVAARMSDDLYRDIPKPLLLADAPNNRLLITANASQLKEIQAIVGAVDVAPQRAHRELATISLQSLNASQVLPSLTQLMRPLIEAHTDASSRPEVMPDVSGKSLIVSATAADLEKIREMVRQLEGNTSAGAARQFKTVKLFNRNPAEVVSLAEQLYREQLKGQEVPAGGPASFVPEVKGNRVIVIGSEAELVRAEAIIRQLDPASPAGQREETRVIRLRSAQAQDLASLVEKSLNASEETVQLLVDQRSNSLVVSGSPDAIEAAAKMIEQLDVLPNAREVRIIELKAANAATIAPMLTDLIVDVMRTARGANYTVQSKIVADATSNRLIVTGTADEWEQINSLAQRLDSAPTESEGTRVFQLRTATASEVAKIVSDAMVTFAPGNREIKRVGVSSDDRSNSLVVTGSREDLQAVASIIEKIDGGGTGEPRRGREIKVLELETDEPAKVVSVAQQVWTAQSQGRPGINDVSLTLDPSGRKVIVVAPGNLMAQVEQMLLGLDQKPDGTPRSLQMIELQQRSATAILPALTRLYEEQSKGEKARAATIMPEASGRRLMVYGSDEQVAAIRALVATLEGATESNDRVTKMFEVGQPEDVARLLPLVQQLYQEQMKDSPAADPADAQILADARAGRIIVTARPAHLAKIEQIIGTLIPGKLEPKKRETRVYNLNSTTADELVTMVRSVYEQELKRHPEILAPEALILPDPLSNRLIVSGLLEEVQIIDEVVQKLDQVSAQTGNTRIVQLKNAQADQVATLLSTTLVRYVGGRNVPRVTIGIDSNNNTLIVSGQPADLTAANSIIEKLDSNAEGSNKQLRIFQIQGGNTSDFSSRLQQLYNDQVKSQPDNGPADALFLPDLPTDRLIVTASEKQIPLIEKLVNDLDKLAGDGARELRLFKLRHNSATAVLPIVNQMFTRNVGNTELSQRLVTTAGIEANVIVAEAPKPILDRVAELIQNVDVAPIAGSGRETRILNLGTAEELQRLSPLVQQLYREQLKGREMTDPPDAQFIQDAAGGRLIVTASTNHLEQIEGLLAKLRENKSPAPADHETRIYNLTSSTAAELAQTLTALYAEEVKKTPALGSSRALILPDSIANRVIVSGPAAQLASIEKLIQELDQVSPQTGGTRVFKLKSADAGQVASVLSSALVEIDRNQRSIPRVSVGTDTNSNSLVVSGEPKDLNAAAVIIEQLDSGTERKDRQMRIISLQSGQAEELAAKVKALYLDQIKNQPGTGPADALILGDAASDRLIIAASGPQLELIQGIVSQLDEVGGNEDRQLAVRPLKKASAMSMAAIIQQFFARNIASLDPAQKLIVTASPDDRSLILEGSEELLGKVSDLAETLENRPAEDNIRVRSYQLAEARAAELAPTLARLFAERRPGDASRPPRFEADAAANLLLVAATPEQFETIDQLVDELKTTASLQNEIRTFRLVNSDATELVPVLSAMLKAEDSTVQSWRRQFRVSVDPKAVSVAAARAVNAIVVQGPPAALATAEQIIRSLDQAEQADKGVIQTVRLKKATVEEVAEAVNKALEARGPKSALQRATVTPVRNSSSVLIDGPADAVREAVKIIQELDLESSGGELEIRVYKLEHGKARELSNLIENMLEGVLRESFRSGRGGGRRPSQVVIAEDDRTNSLIVSAHPDQFKMIEQLLVTLDQNSAQTDRSVRIVLLKNARSTVVADRLNMMFEDRRRDQRPVIEADMFGNTVTIIGSKSDIAEAEAVIAELDSTLPEESIQVRMVVVETLPAEQMAKMLIGLYSQMSGTEIQLVDRIKPLPPGVTNQPAATGGTNIVVSLAVDRPANALLMSGPSHELDAINNLIDELTWSTYGNEAEFRQFSLKEADPVAVAKTLNELFKADPVRVQTREGQQPQVVQPAARMTIVAEPRTRSIIARGKPTDFILLESLLQQLDQKGVSAELVFRLVPLQHADPQKLLPLVNQMVQQLATTRPGEVISVAADVRSRSLFVIARPTVLTEVEALIKSLDTPPAFALADVALVPLKNMVAAQVATLLQGMLKPGTSGESTPEARELQEQVKSLRIKNEAGQEVVLDLSRPIKILAEAGGRNGNRLILSSTPDNIVALRAVVEMMDTPAMVEGVTFKIIHLENADASSVAETLTGIFSQARQLATGPAGPAEPNSETGKALVGPLSVATDRRSNSLILTGKSESIEFAQRLLRDLDQEFKGFVTTVKLFRLDYASAIRLVPLLQAVFAEASPVPGTEGLVNQVTRLQTLMDTNNLRSEKTSLQPRTRAALTIQADDPSNTLVVAARADMLPLIEDVIRSMDIPAATGMEVVRIYPLENADATRLLRVIADIYAARGSQMRPEDKPALSVDTRTNALIVSGNERSFALIETLIKELDKDIPFEYGEFRVIKLENADAATVAQTLTQILETRAQQKAALSAVPIQTLRSIVIGDPRTNTLIVGGPPEVFELVEALAKQMDLPGIALSGQIRLIPLQHANAGTITTALNTLFNQRYSAARGADVARTRPIIIADPRINALLVSAGVEDNKALDELLQKLDQKLVDPVLSLSIVGLQYNDAARVADMIETIFAGRLQAMTLPGSTPNPQERVVVTPDFLSNALVILANKENLEIIRGLIEKLDVEPSVEGGLLQIITLKNADAARVASMLRNLISQGLYRPGMTGGRGAAARSREAMAITVDPRSNTLIVSASPENLAIIRELIERIDSEDYSREGDIRLYTLKNARASQLAQSLQQFFQAKRSGEMQGRDIDRALPVTILADDRTNTLLVTGGKEAFEAVERMLSQLDSADVYDKMNFRVFSLKNTTASKLQSTLTRLFQNRPARVANRPSEPITIVADQWANALIVGASTDDMAMAAGLIETLDNTLPDNGMQVQVIPIEKGDATSIAQTITSLYQETPGTPSMVKVDVDPRLNALVVSAGEADLARISELVKKLDTAMVSRVSEIRIFPLQFAQADELAQVLTIAVTGRPVDGPTTGASAQRQSMLQFITRTPEGEELVASALKESLLITADRRRNALVVSAPVDSMNLLARIIKSLDSEAPQIAKIKVFKLQNADARQMADVLTSLFRLRQQPGVPANQRAIQYTLVRDVEAGPGTSNEPLTATIGSAEQYALTVTIDLRTNSLLLGGTDHYVGLASHIIEELDSTPAQEHQTEVYRLKNSLATNVVNALTSFIEQERQRIVAIADQSDMGTNSVSSMVGNLQQQFEREIAVVAEPVSNTLLLSASPRYFDRYKELIDKLDQPMAQVLIQIILAEVTLDKTSELGVEWTVQSQRGDTQITTGTDFGVAQQFQQFGGFSSAITGSDVGFVLRALEADGRLEVLSRPQILTADNMKATIDIGQRVPIITNSRITDNDSTINSYAYEDVGVSLTVTPRISPDGYVKMEVEPVISQIVSGPDSLQLVGANPIISQRKATTTVSVQDGQSVIIGGLISTTDDKRRAKVPILGSIPYLGVLFRSSRAIEDRKELLIILTPQLMLTPQSAANMTQDQLQRSTIKDEIKRDKLQRQILDPIIPMFDSAPPPGPIETNSVPKI